MAHLANPSYEMHRWAMTQTPYNYQHINSGWLIFWDLWASEVNRGVMLFCTVTTWPISLMGKMKLQLLNIS